MKMRILNTTDGRYIGAEFDSTDTPVVLAPDVEIKVERVADLGGDRFRFISSTYIIDASEA